MPEPVTPEEIAELERHYREANEDPHCEQDHEGMMLMIDRLWTELEGARASTPTAIHI